MTPSIKETTCPPHVTNILSDAKPRRLRGGTYPYAAEKQVPSLKLDGGDIDSDEHVDEGEDAYVNSAATCRGELRAQNSRR